MKASTRKKPGSAGDTHRSTLSCKVGQLFEGSEKCDQGRRRADHNAHGRQCKLALGDPDVQAAVGEYHAYINKYFYTCDVEFMRNLSNMWVEDARFAINYERIREGGAKFVREAVHIF